MQNFLVALVLSACISPVHGAVVSYDETFDGDEQVPEELDNSGSKTCDSTIETIPANSIKYLRCTFSTNLPSGIYLKI